MGRIYRHLTKEERIQIVTLLRENKNQSYIARLLHRSRSSISREVSRNSGLRGYRAKQAHDKAEERKRKPRYLKMTSEIQSHIEQKIKEDWSPMQIANTMNQSVHCTVSHERIYQHTAEDKRAGGELFKHLRINNRRRYRRNRNKANWRTKIPARVDIEQRPASINERQDFGDWEADLVCGGGYLVTLVERKGRFTLIGEVTHKRADLVANEIIRLLRPYAAQVKSITYDNGPEFSSHSTVNLALDCTSYFAKPYHSWERGANENVNGLIRQYFPKGEKIGKDNSDKIALVQNRLNERPKKVLGWKTPKQIFLEQGMNTESLTVALGT